MRPATVAAGGVLMCLLLVAAVLVGSRGPGPLDQPDRANQRNGLLLSGPTVEASLPGLTPGRGPTVLLFVRAAPEEDVLQAWRSQLPTTTRVVLVVQEPGVTAPEPAAEAAAGAGVELVVDTDGRLAAAVDLPEPVDGGLGIGYAVVTRGVVRYSTLDPAWPDNAFEVDTVVGATS